MKIYFELQTDCEATQSSVADPGLGERALSGLSDILGKTGLKGTFQVVPGDLQVHGDIYKDLEAAGHEIGLHIHPNELGYDEFLGVYGADEQIKIIGEAMATFKSIMGRDPVCFTPGYASANDHTFPVLETLGFKHGLVSIPTRNLPQCACVWGDSPLFAHYPHRHNRCLTGDVDFVNIPGTIDPDSRMWGGAHPQDLRVELVDAKNHFYTIKKAVDKQIAAGDKAPVKYIKALTHNIFDYSKKTNFRRETLFGIIDAAKRICESAGCELVGATSADIAADYRDNIQRPQSGVELKLDTSGRN